MIELRDPWFLLLTLLIPWLHWLLSRPAGALRFSSNRLVKTNRKTWRERLSSLPIWLFSLGFLATTITLARPRSPQSERKVSREGIAVMMVVDRSPSMDARDLVEEDRTINRLDVVKNVFIDFVLGDAGAGEGRPNDLVGIVTFAGYADSVCPLTLDHRNLVSIVQQLSIVKEQSESGTAIGDGLGLAVERLRQSEAESKIAILLTDGVNNSGAISPLDAAELASKLGIRVYAIGAGTEGFAPIPMRDFFGRPQLVSQPVEIDEKTLSEIAEKTGGRYFRATDKQGLQNIYQEIDQLERTKVSESVYLQYDEHYAVTLWTAVLLFGASLFLEHTIFRTYP